MHGRATDAILGTTEHARLKDHILNNMDDGLSAKVNEGGMLLKTDFFLFLAIIVATRVPESPVGTSYYKLQHSLTFTRRGGCCTNVAMWQYTSRRGNPGARCDGADSHWESVRLDGCLHGVW